VTRSVNIEPDSASTHKQPDSAISSSRSQQINRSNRCVTKRANRCLQIFRQAQRQREIISATSRQNPDDNLVVAHRRSAHSIDKRLHRPIAAHRKQQSGAISERHPNALLHRHNIRSNHKLRLHLQSLKRTTHYSQVPLSPSRSRSRAPARNRIHEHNALRLPQKFREFAHRFVMLTNTASAVNAERYQQRQPA
jgi:hypothetical protein